MIAWVVNPLVEKLEKHDFVSGLPRRQRVTEACGGRWEVACGGTRERCDDANYCLPR